MTLKKKKKGSQSPLLGREEKLYSFPVTCLVHHPYHTVLPNHKYRQKCFLLKRDKVSRGMHRSMYLHHSLIFQGTSLLLKSLFPYSKLLISVKLNWNTSFNLFPTLNTIASLSLSNSLLKNISSGHRHQTQVQALWVICESLYIRSRHVIFLFRYMKDYLLRTLPIYPGRIRSINVNTPLHKGEEMRHT